MRVTNTKRIVYILLGTICLIIGAIGIVVPLLPTTPLWLLTCWFYFRGSRRLYNRVMNNHYFGYYVKGFLVDKAIPLHSKIISVSIMWVSCIGTVLFLTFPIWAKVILILITSGVTIHILLYPTKK